MRMLVTGGAGFIGSNLVRQALAQGGISEIIVLDDLSTGLIENLDGLEVTFVKGSLLDESALDEALHDVDVVVHLAAVPSVPRSIRDPLTSHHANATGTLFLLEGCRRHGVSYITAASSSSVYGLNPALPKHEREWVRPLSPYAVSKLASEQYLLAYQTSFDIPSLAFRFFNVYGPGQSATHAYAAVIPVFIDAMLDGRPLLVNGDGTQSRDFTYVGTVCRIIMDAVMRKLSHPEPVNLAFGTRTTLLELVEHLAPATGMAPHIEHRDPRAGDVQHSQADNTVLRSMFPDIEPVTLDAGLRATVDWFQSMREVKS